MKQYGQSREILLKLPGQSKHPLSKNKVCQCFKIISGAILDKKGLNFHSFVFLHGKMVCSISFKTKNT